MGRLHSLTLIKETVLGRRRMTSPAQASAQPQSQASNRCLSPVRWMPSAKAPFTSAMTSAAVRSRQRGQLFPAPCDQQFVGFSDAVMVKKPPSSGTARQMRSTDSVRNFRTAGWLVQSMA